jgi:polyhydroxyalkanoate synthesis regulator phasin
MPPAKRATTSSSKSSKPASKRANGSRATKAAASSGTKATATTKGGARSGGSGAAAKRAGASASSTARTARSGAKGTATAAKRGAGNTQSRAKAAVTSTRRASGGDGVASVAEQLVKGTVRPQDVVMLTRDRISETLDDAASRGRVTRKDADDLVTELVRRGRSQSDDFRKEIQALLGRAETATKRARGSRPVDRLVRGADRARRAASVGPSFPIMDYDGLNVAQVQARLKDLSKPERRKVLTYERKHANRKTVVTAIEKSLS